MLERDKVIIHVPAFYEIIYFLLFIKIMFYIIVLYVVLYKTLCYFKSVLNFITLYVMTMLLNYNVDLRRYRGTCEIGQFLFCMGNTLICIYNFKFFSILRSHIFLICYYQKSCDFYIVLDFQKLGYPQDINNCYFKNYTLCTLMIKHSNNASNVYKKYLQIYHF